MLSGRTVDFFNKNIRIPLIRLDLYLDKLKDMGMHINYESIKVYKQNDYDLVFKVILMKGGRKNGKGMTQYFHSNDGGRYLISQVNNELGITNERCQEIWSDIKKEQYELNVGIFNQEYSVEW
jgi:hypothetical protein